MFKLKPVLLSLLSGFLLVFSWPPLPTAFLLAFAFVPLFVLHVKLKDLPGNHFKFWAWTCLSLFIFNLGATWWVWNASPSGCIIMLFSNTLILSVPFLLFSLSYKVFPRISYFSFIVYYLSIEYFHFNWNAAWPWMTLGKGLSSAPFYIQWYEYTGEMGGSLLILLLNMMVLRILIQNKLGQFWKPIALILLFGIWSFLCSLSNFEINKGRQHRIECVVSQPNVDPYEEKFGDGNNYIYPEIQLEYAIDPSRPLITPETEILLLPETAIVGFNDEAGFKNMALLEPIKQLSIGNKLNVIAGAETYSLYHTQSKPTKTARYDSFSSSWFDNYNTAINVKDGEVKEVYHKSKLVAGVETMPFAFLEKLSINLGGTSGSLASSDQPVNFTLHDGTKIAPLICYESIFGDYTNEFIKDGAQALVVITNDGWWGNSPGYKQHLLYGAIRCIETRKEMIRSANTGISAKINKFGRITHQTRYKERTAFKCHLQPNDQITFYVRHGNLIGKTSYYLALLIVLITLIGRFIRKPQSL